MKLDEIKERQDSAESKKVQNTLSIFQALSRDDAEEDAHFEKIKSFYESMSEAAKASLFKQMVEKIEISKETLDPLLEKWSRCEPGDPDWSNILSDLRGHINSPRWHIFRKISRLPGGLKFLLDFRGDLLSIQRFSKVNLKPLDRDIVLLFELWFQEGFLYLEEITLDSSYRQIELIKNSDLVHPMTSIEEMGQRLGKDRRCFALYHRLIPYEPIVFIEVALTRGIVRTISDIIDVDGERMARGSADTAVFYSINNTQNGLAGLGLGSLLIGEVVEYSGKEEEGVKQFATLSPLPGFWVNYLKVILEGKDEPFLLKREGIADFFSKKQISRIMEFAGLEGDSSEKKGEALLSLLSREDWALHDTLIKDFEQPLTRIAYFYISKEKKPRGKPLNPVANFHLGNGAIVTQKNVNFLGNPSPRGLKESCGIMVNYIYTPGWLDQIKSSFHWFDRLEMKGIFSR